jgi:hypothetical protein
MYDSRAFNFGEFVDGRAQQTLSPILRRDEAALANFSSSCRNLALRILKLIAMGLRV